MYAIKEMAILQEAKDVKLVGTNKVRFTAKLQRLNEFSYNGKKYLKEPMLRAINAKQDLLKQNGFVGELDHPIEPSMQRMVNVLYQNASHLFKEIYTENNDVFGVLENTSNRVGLDLYAFIVHDKIPVGFSLRALGDVRNTSQGQEVHNNIDLVTWDCVSTPSFSSCILTEIVNVRHLESYMFNNDLANLEEYVHGKSDVRNQMLLESKVSTPLYRVVNKIEQVCLFESQDTKINTIRNMIKNNTKRKLLNF